MSQDTNLYRGWGQPFGSRYSARHCRRHGSVRIATLHCVRSIRRGMGLGITIQFCIATRRRRYGRRRPATRRLSATIRLSTCHDTAPSTRCARDLGIVCTQPGPWVCALCTQPSFDSGHCFESLFLSTVHEVFKNKK